MLNGFFCCSVASSVLDSPLAQSIAAGLPTFVVQTLQSGSGAPTQCVTTAGEEGLCLLAKVCNRQGGVSVGRCADKLSVCCVRE